MTIGERIEKVVKSQNISLRELSKRAEIPYTTLYSIVKRGSKKLSHETISKLADALGVRESQLTSDGSIRVSTDSTIAALQEKVVNGTATDKEKAAWVDAETKALKRAQTSISVMLSELEQYDETKEIARQSRLMSMFNQLTDDGQEKALDFLEIMLGNPKYKK